jgi:ankyrin repeat protein
MDSLHPAHCRQVWSFLHVERGAHLEPNMMSSAVWQACQDGNIEVLEFMAQRGFNLHSVGSAAFDGDAGEELLLNACRDGRTVVVEFLLGPGANVRAGRPLSAALAHDHLDAAEVLLRHGADVNEEDGLPLRMAVGIAERGRRLRMLDFLLERGALVIPRALEMARANRDKDALAMLDAANRILLDECKS